MISKRRANRILSFVMTLLLTVSAVLPASTYRSYAYKPVLDPVGKKVETILSRMTLEQKIAQMMIVAMPSSKAAGIQKQYQFGGYILFHQDFKRTNKSGMKKLLKSCQRSSKIPMLIGTDEEGGIVVRASLYGKYRSKRFRSQGSVFRGGSFKAVQSDTKAKDKFMKSLGLNTNFAPVADVPYNRSDFMYDRAYSVSAIKTSKCIRRCIKQMDKDNMVSVLKHFPGYGNNGDTHGMVIRDKRSRNTFVTRDLKPFTAGIEEGADMVMVSHTIVNAFDKKNPASLSKPVHKYLRKKMDFEGVIITDGLGMKGITDHVGGSQSKAAVRSVKAGNDMLCVTGDYENCYKALLKAAKQGTIRESQIDDSVRRILRMKIKRGIIK